ncbi:MAG: FHA domain-containing protein [Planctomycetaceae bacterium]|nr:FHA domain-containing protein [Planctomycetaceae bacterium]
MKVSFQILTGRHQGKLLTLPSPVVTVGRDPNAEIRVNSTEVSRHHCEIHVRENEVFVKDLGSRNGTFVNGESIFEEVQLKPGDTLHVGSMVFELMGKKKPAVKSPGNAKPPGARAAAKSASEEDVIDWLAEEEPVLDEDTTIISSSEATQMQMDLSDSGMMDSGEIVPRTHQVKVQPVQSGSEAEKAAEIIKQFWSGKS